MKEVSHKIVEGGGIVRSIRNHGIRDLPHRFKARFPDKEGNRYFYKGRFVSVYYDSNPQTMRDVESILTRDDMVLRNTHLKARNQLWYINVAREDRNPYIQRVLQQEKQAKEQEAMMYSIEEPNAEDSTNIEEESTRDSNDR